MARRPTIKHGTANDLASVADGYTSSGESEFSRRAAHPVNIKFDSFHARPPKKPKARLSAEELIGKNCHELENMTAELVTADAERATKLKANIEIKSAFIARLEREIIDAS